MWSDVLFSDILMVGSRVVLGEVVGLVESAGAPIETEEFSKHPISKPVKTHVIDFSCLGRILLLIIPSAVELSVWIGVGGCLCPSASKMVRAWAASRAMM